MYDSSLRMVAALLLATVAFWAGCSVEDPPNEKPVHVLPQNGNGNFVLYVSNQSFEINPVDIKVFIDGEQAIQDDFDNTGNSTPQHNWIRHVFLLSTGKHTIKVVSKKGAATLEKEFEINDKHWAVIDYWYYSKFLEEGKPSPKSFDFHIRDQPIYFQ